MTNKKEINLAILGYGVVGSGVRKLIETRAVSIKEKFGVQINLLWILDRKPIADLPIGTRQAQCIEDIVEDHSVDVVIETLGGTQDAYNYTLAALNQKKHVVTSNKAMVADHGPELLALAKDKGSMYLYEAAVGGGIPMIRSIRDDLAANEIYQLTGILNGTSNFILDRMETDDEDFASALKDAKDLGFAEQDPSMDINGLDTARKLSILVSRISATYLAPDKILTSGIERVSLAAIRFAKKNRSRIKLLALANLSDHEKRKVIVAPFMLPRTHPLYQVNSVYNALLLDGSAIGPCMYYGQGAGSLPTASSVISDIISIVRAPFTKDCAELWATDNEHGFLAEDELDVQAFIFPNSDRTAKLLMNDVVQKKLLARTPTIEDTPILQVGFTGRLTEVKLREQLSDLSILDDVFILRHLGNWDSASLAK